MDQALAEIRYATHKAWVLGSEQFKRQIAEQLNWPVSPSRKTRSESLIIGSDPKISKKKPAWLAGFNN